MIYDFGVKTFGIEVIYLAGRFNMLSEKAKNYIINELNFKKMEERIVLSH